MGGIVTTILLFVIVGLVIFWLKKKRSAPSATPKEEQEKQRRFYAACAAVLVVGAIITALAVFPPRIPNVVWVGITLTMTLLFFILPGKWRWSSVAGIFLVLLLWFGPGIDRAAVWLGKGVNYSDWSWPPDSIKRVSGGTFEVPPRTTSTIKIRGRVRVPLHVGYCLDVAPEQEFDLRWDNSIRNAYVTPLAADDAFHQVTFTSLPARECAQ